jgi:hypothetical protein
MSKMSARKLSILCFGINHSAKKGYSPFLLGRKSTYKPLLDSRLSSSHSLKTFWKPFLKEWGFPLGKTD